MSFFDKIEKDRPFGPILFVSLYSGRLFSGVFRRNCRFTYGAAFCFSVDVHFQRIARICLCVHLYAL